MSSSPGFTKTASYTSPKTVSHRVPTSPPIYRLTNRLLVPTTYSSLNILLQDVPAGDDYFLLCLNSTHGVVYSVSSRFTITNSSTPSNPNPNPSVPTVTVSGPPNPLKQFAATLGPSANGGSSLSENSRALGFGVIISLCAAFLGGAMTLW